MTNSLVGSVDILSVFKSPSSQYRPWPLFVLSDEFEEGGGERRITALLEAMANAGYGGIFIHPRPGLITEYLSERWFEVVRHCIRECLRLGMVPALYDENSYPSGFAGGHVPSAAPGTVARHVDLRRGKMPDRPNADAVAVYSVVDGKINARVDVRELSAEDEWMAFEIKPMEPMPWHGGFAYVSLLEPETTQAFLRSTYDRYRDELGEELWGACAAIFTDEPHLVGGSHGPWARGLPFSRYVQASFRAQHGYGIEERMADLYVESETSAATRHDFYETLHTLWFKNFAKPLEAWCHNNRIPLTGHYLEHDWPCPYATPGHIHMLAHMDWPGTDLLECYLLEGHDYNDPQNFDPSPAGVEPHALYYLKQVQSVANQFGKPRVMNESWGAGGHDSTPHDWLRIGRYLAVHGVNLFVPHYSTVTIRGARKCDHPQFFSPQSPWFDSIKPVNDELGRLSWLVANGRTRQRVLVLDPLTTGFCISNKSDCLGQTPEGLAAMDAFDALADCHRSVRALRQATTGFAQALSDAQCDFDIGDEFVIEESGVLNADALEIGQQSYRIVVLPPGLRNLRTATFNMLASFIAAGGKVFGVKPETPAWLDGRSSDWPERLGAQWFANADTLRDGVLCAVPPRIRLGAATPAGLAHQRRVIGDGTFYLFVNSSPVSVCTPLEADEKGPAAWLDPASGEITAFEGQLTLDAGAAGILWIGDGAQDAQPARKSQPIVKAAGEHLDFLDAAKLHPNILAVDTCSLSASGREFPEQLVYESSQLLWQANGMPVNGWAGVVQFRKEILSYNDRMLAGSGGVARYRVRIDEGVTTSAIELAIECPELWNLRVNGQSVDTTDWVEWLDPRIAKGAIGTHLHVGDNIIEIEGRPFDVRMEIDQIYLLGDFGVEADNPGFRIVKCSTPITLGPWKELGMPFYDRKVAYRFRNPMRAATLHLPANAWHGACVEVACGDFRRICYGPEIRCDIPASDALDLVLTVTGLPINLLGPWHKPGLLPKHGWANFWHGGDVPNAPQPGNAYYQLNLGIFEPPQIL